MEPVSFASLLRGLRTAAALSQEALAERAAVSAAAIGAYERGLRTAPHRDTVEMLATALELSGDERTAFKAAARPKASARAE
jgi:transcriptional regulator with XRE-family HTH domain